MNTNTRLMKSVKYLLLISSLALLGAACKRPPLKEGEYTARVLHFLLSDDEVAMDHLIGVTSCPQDFPVLKVEAPIGTRWAINPDTKPDWYAMVGYPENEGVIEEEVTELQAQFNCDIDDFTDHQEEARVEFNAYDDTGELFATEYVDYMVNIETQ